MIHKYNGSRINPSLSVLLPAAVFLLLAAQEDAEGGVNNLIAQNGNNVCISCTQTRKPMCFPFQFMTLTLSTEHLPWTNSQFGLLAGLSLVSTILPSSCSFPGNALHSDIAAWEYNKSTHTCATCLLPADEQQKMVGLHFYFYFLKCCNFLVKMIDNEVRA